MPRPYATRSRYRPLDEVLDRPRVRILRALRWFDWVEPQDLFAAIGAPDEETLRDRYVKALSQSVLAGHVERAKRRTRVTYRSGHGFLAYVRLTESGHREIQRELATTELAV